MPGAGLVRCALVVAGAEGAPCAGEDDHAHGAVRIRPVEDPMQLGFELVRECVHALGAIERDGRDAVLDAVKDLLAHPSSSRCCGRLRGWSPAEQYASPIQGDGHLCGYDERSAQQAGDDMLLQKRAAAK